MDAAQVREELKLLMVTPLNLEGKSPANIVDSARYFGRGSALTR